VETNIDSMWGEAKTLRFKLTRDELQKRRKPGEIGTPYVTTKRETLLIDQAAEGRNPKGKERENLKRKKAWELIGIPSYVLGGRHNKNQVRGNERRPKSKGQTVQRIE